MLINISMFILNKKLEEIFVLEYHPEMKNKIEDLKIKQLVEDNLKCKEKQNKIYQKFLNL